MTPLATRVGIPKDEAYRAAFWRAFNELIGPEAPVVKALLLARYPHGDEGVSEEDRTCFGLRQTIPLVAEVLGRRTLRSLGYDLKSLNDKSTGQPAAKDLLLEQKE